METVIRQPGEAHPVPGHFAVVKVASDESDERFCVLEATLAANGGLTSRLHRHHKHVESWFVVDGTLVVEIKSVDRLVPLNTAQLLTYLRLTGLHQGLIFNFNVTRLVNGLKSVVHRLGE